LKPNKQQPEHASTLYYSPKPQYKLTMNTYCVCSYFSVYKWFGGIAAQIYHATKMYWNRS